MQITHSWCNTKEINQLSRLHKTLSHQRWKLKKRKERFVIVLIFNCPHMSIEACCYHWIVSHWNIRKTHETKRECIGVTNLNWYLHIRKKVDFFVWFMISDSSNQWYIYQCDTNVSYQVLCVNQWDEHIQIFNNTISVNRCFLEFTNG